jgi:hypothetical protein
MTGQIEVATLDWTESAGSYVAPSSWGLCSGRLCRPVLPVHAIGRASVKRAMRPDLIIEGDVAGHPFLGMADGLVGMEIDLFVFEAPP